jgi:hypothetical protein
MASNSAAPPPLQDFGDAEDLTRKELQTALKAWNVPSGGSTVVLKERYTLFRTSRIPEAQWIVSRNYKSTSSKPCAAAASRKRPPAPPVEKRLKRYRSSCPQGTQQRIARARTQQLFLVQKGDVTNLSCSFVVLGSTGNVYTVKIERVPDCTCPDHAKGNLCKHILFVLLKVMALDANSPLVYQAAWLSSELKHMFQQLGRRYQQLSHGTSANATAVLANAAVRAQFAKSEQQQGGEDADVGAKDDTTSLGVARRPQDQDEDCPICFDALLGGGGGGGGAVASQTTYCRARCGANFHRVCIRHWLEQPQQRSSPTCPMCRELWNDGTSNTKTNTKANHNQEGFTNLGGLQGQSPDRDTSSYSSWAFGSPEQKRRRRW